MKILNIAEKPSVAKSITRTITTASLSSPSKYKYTPVYKFNYSSDQHFFTSVLGHLYHQEFKERGSWSSIDPINLFSTEIGFYIKEEFRKLKENLLTLSAAADKAMIWTDCDREGEYIALEIQRLLQRKCYRARFSAITRDEVFRAMENPRDIDMLQCYSVEVRMELDLRIGASFTRLQTLNLVNDGPGENASGNNTNGNNTNANFNRRILSYGSCQIPTLGFVVERSEQHKNFQAEKFFTLKICIFKKKENIFSWKRGSVFDRNCVLYFLNYLLETGGANNSVKNGAEDGNAAVIISIEKKATTRLRPFPLRTVDMQKILSRFMSSHKIMQIAESLYQRGIISYPRTETDCFPRDFDYRKVFDGVKDGLSGERSPGSIVLKGPRRGSNNDFAHLPIYPLKLAQNLNQEENTVYNFIRDRFIAAISDDATLEELNVLLKLKEEYFCLKGLKIIKKGFLSFYKYDRVVEKVIDDFREGERFIIKGEKENKRLLGDIIEIRNTGQEFDVNRNTENDSSARKNKIFLDEGMTKPPSYLTESELISLMDKNGIGTDATIHEHIKKILDRNYALKKFKFFIPTGLGNNLIRCYKVLNLDLDKPNFRRELEVSLREIELGRINKLSVLSFELERYKGFYRILQNNLAVLKDVIKNNSDNDSDDGEGGDNSDGGGRGVRYRGKERGPNYAGKENDDFVNQKRVKGRKTGGNGNGENYKTICDDILALKSKRSNFIKESTGNFNNEDVFSTGKWSKRENANNFNNMNNINNGHNANNFSGDKHFNNFSGDNHFNNFSGDNSKRTECGTAYSNNSAKNYLSGDENVQCDCREQSKISIVKKGKNKGKEFHSCSKFPGGCNFFQWKGIVRLKDSDGPGDVKCFCDSEVRKFVSNTEKTRGKMFFKCNRRYKPCKFFMWEEEA